MFLVHVPDYYETYIYSVLAGPDRISHLHWDPLKLLFPRLYLPILESHYPVWYDSQIIAQDRVGQCSRSVQGTTPCLLLVLPGHAWPSLSKPWHSSVSLITPADTQGELCSFTEQVGQKHAVKAQQTPHPCTANELQPWPKSPSKYWTPGLYSYGLSGCKGEQFVTRIYNYHFWPL